MKKRLGQIVFSFAIVLLSFNSYASYAGKNFPVLKQTIPYKIFRPVLESIGFRPLQVKVIDGLTSAPLENAVVMIGQRENGPFDNNWVKTDLEGKAVFDGFLLPQGDLIISIRHADYSGMTIFNTKANRLEIPLTKLQDTSKLTTIKGSFQKWPHMEDFDGTMHMGIMLPFVDMLTLANFNTDKLLAPYVRAEIYKETDVPGNIVIPTQEERFMGFIPVYVSKPRYVMPFRTGSVQNMIALTGEVPFSKMAKKLVNKAPLTEILNLISLTQFGLVTNFEVPHKRTRKNIPLDFKLRKKFNVYAHHVPARKDVIYISMSALKQNPSHIFPVDFKTSARKERNKMATLKAPAPQGDLPDHNNIVATLAIDLPKNSDDKRKLDSAVTGGVQRPKHDQSQVVFDKFLNLHDLSYNEENGFSYAPRHRIHDTVESHLNVSYINIVLPSTKKKKGTHQTWWTIVTPASVQEFKLPIMPQNLSKPPTLKEKEEIRWTLNRFGLHDEKFFFNYDNLNYGDFVNHITHFSHNEITLVQ